MSKNEQNQYISNLQSTIELIERSQAIRLSYESLNKNDNFKDINNNNNINSENTKKIEHSVNEKSKNIDESEKNTNDNNITTIINKTVLSSTSSSQDNDNQINELKNLIEKQKQDNASIIEQNNYLIKENEKLLNGERPLRKQIKCLANYLRDIRSLRDEDGIRYEQIQKRFFDNIEELLSTVDGSIYAFKGSFTGQDFPGLPIIKKKQIENIIDLLVGCFAHIRSAAEKYPDDDILVFISLCVNICHSLSLCSCHINNLMKDINEGNELIGSLENENIDIKNQLQSMIEINEQLLEKYNKTLENNKLLEEKCNKYSKQYNENLKGNKDLNENHNKVNNENSDKEIQFNDTSNLNDNDIMNSKLYIELNKNHNTLNTKYQNSKKIIAKIQKEFKKSTKLNILLNQKLKSCNEEYFKLKNANENEIKKNQEYKLELKELNIKNQEIIKELNESKDFLKIKEKKEKESEMQKQHLYNESKNLKDELKSEIKSNMKQVDSLKKKILAYDSEVNNFKDIVEKQKNDIMNLKQMISTKDKIITDSQQKILNNSKLMSKDIQNYKEKITNLTKENSELNDKLKKVKEHKDFVENTMIHWKKENESLRKKISKLSLNVIYSKDFQRNIEDFEKKLEELSFENEKKEHEQSELLNKVNSLENANKDLKDKILKYDENEKLMEKKKSETVNLINMYKAVKLNYDIKNNNDNDKSEKLSVTSGSTIKSNDNTLFNEKIDDINDVIKNIINEYNGLKSQITEYQDINKSLEKSYSGMIDEKQRDIKEQIKKSKRLEEKIDKLTKENNEKNTILSIYNDQYIEVCRSFLLFSFSSELKEKLLLKPGLKNHPYPFNKDIYQLCLNYQDEINNKIKIEKELKNLKAEIDDKDVLLNEKLEKLNLLNEKYTKCQEDFTNINDKYKLLETKSSYDNNELKRQLDQLSDQKGKLESTLNTIKKGYEQMIIKTINAD